MYLNPLSSTSSGNYGAGLHGATSNAAPFAEASTSSSEVINLSANQSGAGSAAITPLQSILAAFVGKSLEAENIVPQSELAGTRISFDSMSYFAAASSSASIGLQGQQLGTDQYQAQNAMLAGDGEVTTADGTVYDFHVQFLAGEQSEVSSSQTIAAGLGGNAAQLAQGASGDADGDSAAGVATATSDVSSNYLAQLAQAMEQTGTQSVMNHPGSGYQGGSMLISPPQTGNQAAQTQESSANNKSSIDWDALQQQAANLIDLFDALVPANQDTSSGAVSGAVSSALSKVIAASNTNSTGNANFTIAPAQSEAAVGMS
jgi:hypothetical protein